MDVGAAARLGYVETIRRRLSNHLQVERTCSSRRVWKVFVLDDLSCSTLFVVNLGMNGELVHIVVISPLVSVMKDQVSDLNDEQLSAIDVQAHA